MIDATMRRIRRVMNSCYVELRPLRHQLRNPAVRESVCKWMAMGTALYVVMYVTFFIAARHKYLLGFNDYDSDLLMKQYELDLQTCWHSLEGGKGQDGAGPATDSLNAQWPAELFLISPSDVSEANQHTVEGPVEAGHGIRRDRRTVLSLTSSPAVPPASLDRLLDAGSCVAFPASAADSSLRGLSPASSAVQDIRCLPSFIIAGAMKCGTGELMKWLQLHPKLALGTGAGDKREVHYFTSTALSMSDSNYKAAPDSGTETNSTNSPSKLLEYAQFFPAFTAQQAREVYTFEKSPDYIREATALRSIHALLPRVKIVLLLRNPSLRALSEFNHHCRHERYGRVTKDVHSAVTGALLYGKDDVVRADLEGPRGLGKGSYELLSFPCSAQDAETYFMRSRGRQVRRRRQLSNSTVAESNYTSTSHGGTAEGNNTISSSSTMGGGAFVPEIEHGFYERQLQHLLALFPASQVLVLLQEDMYRHTFGTLRQVEEFLQLPCFNYKDFILRQPLSAGATADIAGTLAAGGLSAGEEVEEDDGVYELSAVGASSQQQGGKEKDAALVPLRPPKRVPLTFAEQVAHYRAELKGFLSSWRGADQEMRHLYGDCSPAFRAWLDDSVYRPHNRRLSALLGEKHGRGAFTAEHLREMGWPM